MVTLLIAVVLIPVVRCQFSPTYFGIKRNFLNEYVAKLGWGWLLVCLIPVSFTCSLLYSGLQSLMVVRHLFRLVVGHGIFMLVTSLVIPLSTTVLPLSFGHCANDKLSYFQECITNGSYWIYIDISGHSFLLAYCIFVITEECQMIKPYIWNSYSPFFDTSTTSSANLLSRLHSCSFLLIKIFEVLACFEIFIFGTIFIATQLYYHTFIENFLGYLLGVVCWFMTYKLFYGRFIYGPSAVYDGHLNPLKNYT